MIATFALLAAVSLVLVLVVPVVPLFVAPLVLGVPHLAADLRYLVVRRDLLARVAVLAFVLAPLGLVAVLSPVLVAAVSLCGVALVARSGFVRRALVLAGACGLVAASVSRGALADAVFVHGHHLIALVAFAALAPRRASTLPALLAIALGATALLIAWADPSRLVAGRVGASFGSLASVLAPGASMRVAATLIAVYALHQSLHYGLWLRLVPDALRERAAPRSFTSSYRALVSELGRAPTAAIALLTATLLVVASLASLTYARDLYMRLALFHGPLELALLALAFAEDRRP